MNCNKRGGELLLSPLEYFCPIFLRNLNNKNTQDKIKKTKKKHQDLTWEKEPRPSRDFSSLLFYVINSLLHKIISPSLSLFSSSLFLFSVLLLFFFSLFSFSILFLYSPLDLPKSNYKFS